MEKIVIAGAGAHCKVVLDVLSETRQYEPVGILDSVPSGNVLGVPVLGADALMQDLLESGVAKAFVAIGNNTVRKKVSMKMERSGFEIVTLISAYAVVSQYATIGKGCLVMPGAIINAGASIGEGCIINTNASVDHDCVIDSYCHVAPGCAISGSTMIGADSFLGTGSRVIDRLKIGKNVMLGAGAVVISDLPDNCTAVGVPARIIKRQEKKDG